jgi:hypothetical protein
MAPRLVISLLTVNLPSYDALCPKREIITLLNAIEQGRLEKALTPADQHSVPHRESGAYA